MMLLAILAFLFLIVCFLLLVYFMAVMFSMDGQW
jgi:hypothetical protein